MNHSENSLVLLVIVFETIYSFGTLFLPCELSQRLCIAFCECGDIVEHFKWYLFPVEVQKMLPMILRFVQKPVVLKCFGSITTDRETFKNVSAVKTIDKFQYLDPSKIYFIPKFHCILQIFKTAFSYFTILRQFFKWTKCKFWYFFEFFRRNIGNIQALWVLSFLPKW